MTTAAKKDDVYVGLDCGRRDYVISPELVDPRATRRLGDDLRGALPRGGRPAGAHRDLRRPRGAAGAARGDRPPHPPFPEDRPARFRVARRAARDGARRLREPAVRALPGASRRAPPGRVRARSAPASKPSSIREGSRCRSSAASRRRRRRASSRSRSPGAGGLEEHRRGTVREALFMKYPSLRAPAANFLYATPEAIEARRDELARSEAGRAPGKRRGDEGRQGARRPEGELRVPRGAAEARVPLRAHRGSRRPALAHARARPVADRRGGGARGDAGPPQDRGRRARVQRDDPRAVGLAPRRERLLVRVGVRDGAPRKAGGGERPVARRGSGGGRLDRSVAVIGPCHSEERRTRNLGPDPSRSLS